ncbi:hypothetical protein SBA4_6610004 [Candidatus Sulfopaludibacter sp. SbA4]|nr:hypothetical protein SBA4_6610004 [Candidatus Sulfopaludibacter sp. SbA4]
MDMSAGTSQQRCFDHLVLVTSSCQFSATHFQDNKLRALSELLMIISDLNSPFQKQWAFSATYAYNA